MRGKISAATVKTRVVRILDRAFAWLDDLRLRPGHLFLIWLGLSGLFFIREVGAWVAQRLVEYPWGLRFLAAFPHAADGGINYALYNAYLSAILATVPVVILALSYGDFSRYGRARDEKVALDVLAGWLSRRAELAQLRGRIEFGRVVDPRSLRLGPRWGVNLEQLLSPHCFIFGQSGSGKTSTSLVHFLRRYAGDSQVGCLVFDAKDGLIRWTDQAGLPFRYAGPVLDGIDEKKKASVSLLSLCWTYPTLIDGIRRIFIDYLKIPDDANTNQTDPSASRWERYGKECFAGLVAWWVLVEKMKKQELTNRKLYQYVRSFHFQQIPQFYEELRSLSQASDRETAELASFALNALSPLAGKKQGEHAESIKTNVRQVLELFGSSDFAEFAQGEEVDPIALLNQGANLFFTTMSRGRILPSLYNIFLNYILQQFTNDAPRLRLVVLVDEASSYSVKMMQDILDKGRSWGVSLTCVWQDLHQISRIYGEQNARAFLTNVSLIFAYVLSAKSIGEIIDWKLGTDLITRERTPAPAHAARFGLPFLGSHQEQIREARVPIATLLDVLGRVNEKYTRQGVGMGCLVMANLKSGLRRFLSVNEWV
ncbi:type IV secretory system conjugative DNA transfer family protein [Thermosulfurimonas sp. F29]|uniref:type IV secretory system conjugative DNA transfer family protein n=1 Tax=Thermosulfurimonas sp. F29 TaxID=2867247 RepID=UPI001C831636|nr:TraM recognition domain-containing protein [Thermosulfurimonas sp. F29]MBX6423807.1 TraM recognition domain-containing protein [Thermosulfurimonas sp. F29]